MRESACANEYYTVIIYNSRKITAANSPSSTISTIYYLYYLLKTIISPPVPLDFTVMMIFSLKFITKCLKTPSKIEGLSFTASNLGNMDFFLIFNCISH